MGLNILDLCRMKIALILILAITVYLLYSYTRPIYQPSLNISIEEARSRRFGLIIDVRTLNEREQLGYYPNSIPMTIESLKAPFDISNKSTWILVYSGDRAVKAAEILYNMGYKNVRYITESYLRLMPGS